MMVTISLCMIVRDEEDVLARCLGSVCHLVDEIIIVDTGSIDKTKEIARRFTMNIYDFKWQYDFALARNYSFRQATKDYILWLDADDVLTMENQMSFWQLKKALTPEIDSVLMKYHVDFDTLGNPTRTTKRHRLVKRTRQFKWIGKIHEYLKIEGVTANSQTSVHHKKLKDITDRNLQIFENRLKNGEIFNARDLIYYGTELLTHKQYSKAIDIFTKFLAIKKGWLEDNLAACVQMGICFGQLNQKEKQIDMLFKTFTYANPRSEVCCRLGEIYLNEYEDMEKAIFWYRLALHLDPPPEMIGLLNEPHTRTWLPHLQLSVCYSNLGDIDMAIRHGEKADKLNPNYDKILNNLGFLYQLKVEQITKQLQNNG